MTPNGNVSMRFIKASPEYIHINDGMDLAGFKTIFFWEYVHRVFGRLIGLAFALPLAFFALKKMVLEGYGLRLVILLMPWRYARCYRLVDG